MARSMREVTLALVALARESTSAHTEDMAKSRITKESALAELATMGLGTREAAMAALVEIQVAKWGEAERASEMAALRGQSHGALLNTIAVRGDGAPNRRLMTLARVLLTSRDRADMRDAATDD